MNNLILALDVSTEREALGLVRKFSSRIRTFKIGSELFTACGPRIVERIRKMGAAVFLDLKFHDIPRTVEKASARAAAQGVAMFTVHASGGLAMLKAAVRGARDGATKGRVPLPLVLGVTVLTSLERNDLMTLGVKRSVQGQVLSLCELVRRAGVGGLVCSALEVRRVRKAVGKKIQLVVPGIRATADGRGDQKRVATAAQAVADGADYLVLGRTITQAQDPWGALQSIEEEL